MYEMGGPHRCRLGIPWQWAQKPEACQARKPQIIRLEVTLKSPGVSSLTWEKSRFTMTINDEAPPCMRWRGLASPGRTGPPAELAAQPPASLCGLAHHR